MRKSSFKFNIFTLPVKLIKSIIIIILIISIIAFLPWRSIGSVFDFASVFSIKTVLLNQDNPAIELIKSSVKPQQIFLLNMPSIKSIDESQMVNLAVGKGQYEYFYSDDSEESATSSSASTSSTTAAQNSKPVLAVNIHPKSSTSYITWSKVYIKNESKQKPTVDSLMRDGLKLNLKKPSAGPQVLILHSHATEAYNETGDIYYTNVSPRSTDNSKNMVRVGEEMTKVFEKNGVKTIHATKQHDYPEFTGSYERSLVTANYYIKKYPTIKVVLDIHRDTIIDAAGIKYRPVVNINGKRVAQIMIVNGTGTKVYPNTHWKENLKFGITLQEKLETKYPGMTRSLLMRDSRYNSHVVNGALLIEVGSCGNSLDEAILAGQYTATAMSEIIKSNIK